MRNKRKQLHGSERQQAVDMAIVGLQRAADVARNIAEQHLYQSMAELLMAREVEMDAVNATFKKVISDRN